MTLPEKLRSPPAWIARIERQLTVAAEARRLLTEEEYPATQELEELERQLRQPESRLRISKKYGPHGRK